MNIKTREITRRKFECNKRDILSAIQMKEEDYYILQFEKAIEWIRNKVWDDEDLINHILKHPDFFSWWINQWNLREEAFVWDYIGYLISGEDFSIFLADAWDKLHNARYINVLPPDDLLSGCIKDFARQRGGVR